MIRYFGEHWCLYCVTQVEKSNVCFHYVGILLGPSSWATEQGVWGLICWRRLRWHSTSWTGTSKTLGLSFRTSEPPTLQRQYTAISKHKFSEMKLRGLCPNSTFMFLWAIYIFPRSVCLFCCRKIGGPIVEIYKSFTEHECGNQDLRRAVSFLGVHKSVFLCSVQSQMKGISAAVLQTVFLNKESLRKQVWSKVYWTNLPPIDRIDTRCRIESSWLEISVSGWGRNKNRSWA